ncbi:MAG TPA: hypothetical protein VFY01_12215 [Rheinheimera sp.]|nr:hypothetical protein [Rheinheimera sp.]
MNAAHSLAESKYQNFRESSLRIAEATLPAGLKSVVNLNEINALALAQAQQWEYNANRHEDASWSWRKGFSHYAQQHPKRFELAIWFAKVQLCGLSIGKPTYSGSKLRLDFIEGAPGKHPLKGKVVELTIAAAEAYADSIGAEQIRIMRPVSAEVVRYYEKHGFTYFSGKSSNVPTHLWRNL